MRTPRITFLVMAHVTALGACKSAPSATPGEELPRTIPAPSAVDVPIAGEPVPTAPTESPSAVPTMVPSVAPMATAAPFVSAKPPERDTTGAVCTTDADCHGLLCLRSRADDGKLDKHGVCGSRVQPTRGRALVVDDTTHVAPVFASSTSHDERVRGLLAEVAEEHASIAAFARTLCELVALGAPLALLRETARALADEVEHTARTVEWAARITGRSVQIAMLPAAVAPLRRGPEDVDALFRDVFRGGAVGETLAAALADEQSLRGPGDMREHYRVLADDEARHAALAFTTLVWLLETYPSLATARDEEIASFVAAASDVQRALVCPLFGALGHVEPVPIAVA